MRKPKALVLGLLAPPALGGAVLALAIALGGPGQPAAMHSIASPYRGVDLSDLPVPSRYRARDGAELAFRRYAPPPGVATRGSVVLVHGSSATSLSLHTMARALAAAGYASHALDIRGHGDSGPLGHIGHIGQLEQDLEDFVRAQPLPRPSALLGFSSGGGFALRVAGGPQGQLFERYVLLSPFISQDAPTYRADAGGWVQVGLPRLIALAVLDSLGIEALHALPVMRFALDAHGRDTLTPSYDFRLAQNFRPRRDYAADIRAVERPLHVIAGGRDEVFHAERFAEIFATPGVRAQVTLLPGLGHSAVTLEPEAIDAVLAALQRP